MSGLKKRIVKVVHFRREEGPMKTRARTVRVMVASVAILVLGAAQAQAMVLVGIDRSPGTPRLSSKVQCYEARPGSFINDGQSVVDIPSMDVTRSPATTTAQYLFLRYSLEYWTGRTFADAGARFSTGWINNGKMQTVGSGLLTIVYGKSIIVPHGWTWRVKIEFAWTTDVYGNNVIGGGIYRPTVGEYLPVNEPLAPAPTIGSWSGYGYCTMP